MRTPRSSRSAPALAAALLLTLGACNSKPTTITGDDTDDQKAAVATAKPVELPPSIQASKTYRCKDSSVAYVDWMSDGKTAMVKSKPDANATMVKATEAGGEMTAAGGYSVKGTPAAGTAEIGVPGHPAQSCSA